MPWRTLAKYPLLAALATVPLASPAPSMCPEPPAVTVPTAQRRHVGDDPGTDRSDLAPTPSERERDAALLLLLGDAAAHWHIR
jgi:hypothetical protein